MHRSAYYMYVLVKFEIGLIWVIVSLYMYICLALVRILLSIDYSSLVRKVSLQVKSFFIAHSAHRKLPLVISHNNELSNWHNILVDQ